jgi:hypothetical protein
MQPRTLFLAALSAFWLTAPPALAGASGQQKFEKKLARYAQSAAALDASKPRGLCVCETDAVLPAGSAGVLVYETMPLVGTAVVVVTCEVLGFDAVGAPIASEACDDWKVLGR